MNPSIAAVCVTYHPDPSRLERLLTTMATQVGAILVMDNSEPESGCARTVARQVGAHHHWLGSNRGLAAGLNAGIEKALAGPFSHVLLLDQDSVPAPEMVSTLLAALTAQPDGVAAVGPAYVDPRAGRAATFPRFRRFPPRRVEAATQGSVFDVDMLITSGTLVPRAALEQIGSMDESLFIDHVDTDWCLRARAAGWRLLVAGSAAMEHRLGVRWVRVTRTRSLPLHTPERLYYQFRNSVRLYRRPHAVWQWITADVRRLVVVLVLHLVASGEPARCLKMAFAGAGAGVRDGAGSRPGTASG